MAVRIKGVLPDAPCGGTAIKSGDCLVKINGHEIMDVLDYRFYQNEAVLTLSLVDSFGNGYEVDIKKGEYEDLGLEFDTYLMDKQRSCRNKCIFCFIDQLPKGMRKSLYFKDDDSRLSFLFGNYITLTNISEHEISRIIKMHISPINVSVHTTNPELRVKMMKNKAAGKSLEILKRFSNAGIAINCQLVLCPGINDGKELERTLSDLIALSSVESIAAVPVGLTKYREGLPELKPFDKQSAGEVIDIIDRFGDICKKRTGSRKVFAADEFYLIAIRQIPPADYYEDFAQLENGVGLWALFKSQADEAIESFPAPKRPKKVSCATGVAAYPLIRNIIDMAMDKWHNLYCEVYPVKNKFFGENITVAGLVTGRDLINQLSGRDLGERLFIPSVMLRREGDMFLDDVTLDELQKALNVRVTPVAVDGYEFIAALTSDL